MKSRSESKVREEELRNYAYMHAFGSRFAPQKKKNTEHTNTARILNNGNRLYVYTEQQQQQQSHLPRTYNFSNNGMYKANGFR